MKFSGGSTICVHFVFYSVSSSGLHFLLLASMVIIVTTNF